MLIWVEDDDLKFWDEADNGESIYSYMCFAPQNDEDLIRLKEFVETFGREVEWDGEEAARKRVSGKEKTDTTSEGNVTQKLDVPNHNAETVEIKTEEIRVEPPKVLYGPAPGFVVQKIKAKLSRKDDKIDPEAMAGVYGPVPGYKPIPANIQTPDRDIPKVYGPASTITEEDPKPEDGED